MDDPLRETDDDEPQVWRRKLNLKAKLETVSSTFSFKRFVLGTFNTGLIGSSCTAPPRVRSMMLAGATQLVSVAALPSRPRPFLSDVSAAAAPLCAAAGTARVWRRELKLKAKFESGSSTFKLQPLTPQTVSTRVLITSTCTALPGQSGPPGSPMSPGAPGPPPPPTLPAAPVPAARPRCSGASRN